jgi:hypothetical protein
MAAPTIQFKRGAYSGITSFRAGEPAFTTDTFDFFIGLDNTLGNNKFFGSHRYWTRETGSVALNLNLVDKDGTNKISLKSPDTLSGDTTYTLPETPVDTYLLTTNGSGVLSWTNAIPGGTITGITTFTDTTDNTLGDADTGAVQIDGGLGVNKNLTVGANLDVQGYSNFVGVVTFRGGTINLGDDNTDDINVAGEFVSNLNPNTDDTYDIGISGKRWRNANFAGVGSFATGAVIDNLQIGISSTNEIDTSSGNLTLDSAGGQVIIDDNLSIAGVSTFTGAIDANGGADISGGETTLSSATVSDLTDNRVVIAGTSGSLEDDGNLTYDGTDLSTNSLIVTDLTDNRVLLAGSGGAVEDSGNLTFDGSTLTVVGYADLDDVNVSSAATIATADITSATIDNLTFTSGTAITSVDTDISSVSASDDTLASAKAIKTYVDAQITAQDLDFSGDSGTGAVNLDSQTLTIAGTANEIETSASGQTLTVGLPDSVTVTTALTTPTVNVTNVKANDGTTAITVSDSTGAVETNSNLTVQGNLYVNGSTTQVNTTSLTVEDTLVELGLVDGNVPVTDANRDLGIIFNYYTSSAKKAAVYWDDSTSRIALAAEVSESSSVLTATTYAPIEISALWVNDCAGQSQVISCTGNERFLENITIDCGSF